MSRNSGWWLTITGVVLMTAVTPGVLISNAEWDHVPSNLPKQLVIPVENSMVAEHMLPLKMNCTPYDDYGIRFNIASYNRTVALTRSTSVSNYVPRPRPRPSDNLWMKDISKRAIAEVENVIKSTKEAGKKYLDLTKRTVTGNGQKMVLEPRTAKMFLELERQWGQRLEVRWAYRDKWLNRKVGGRNKSFHLNKKAVDIVHNGWSKSKMRRFVRLAYRIGFRGFGMGGRVIHLDTRGSLTSWNYGNNVYGLAYSMIK